MATINVTDCHLQYHPERGVLYINNGRGQCILRIQGLLGLPREQLRGLDGLFAPMLASIELRPMLHGIDQGKWIKDQTTHKHRALTEQDCFIAVVE